jgi:hypothetical protein
MSMRDKIVQIISDEYQFGGKSLAETSDAILEALLDMIPSLVWKKSKNFRVRTTKMNLGLQYSMQISLSGGAIWSVNTVKGWHSAFDEHEAEFNINNHHRATIMAEFKGDVS